jgi:hypothetical protein
MTRKNRDEFSPKDKMTLCLRSGTHCSNPECRKPTTGPTTDKKKVNSIGQAAHITAAASGRGGARYDSSMTPEERSDIDNGIWLCQNCATMIDRDPDRYTVALLKDWKRQAENAADREHGQTPTSAAENALMRSVIFKTPLGRSVASAVADITHLTKQELEKADPRFSVQVDVAGNTAQLIFHAKEPVHFSAKIEPDRQAEFQEKMQALIEHGMRVEMDASSIRLEGSVLLDMMPHGAGTITFDTQMRRKAIQKVMLRDPVTNAIFVLDDLVGEIVAGSQSFTFEGSTFGDLYRINYRCNRERDVLDKIQPINFEFRSEQWRGRPVRDLPYLDKIYRYIDALRGGSEIFLSLEVEGRVLLEATSSQIMAPDAINELHFLLAHIRRVRDLLALWNTDVDFDDSPVAVGDIGKIHALWMLMCDRPKKSGEELSPGHANVTPQNENEANTLRTAIESRQALAIAFGREFPETFNLVGSYISVHPVRLHYSQVNLQASVPIKEIGSGRALRVDIVPTKHCNFSIELSHPPCTLVTGPEKSITPQSEA